MRWPDGPRMKYIRDVHACVSIAGNGQNHWGGFVVGGSFGHDLSKILKFDSNKWIKVGSSLLESSHDHVFTAANSPEYILHSVERQDNGSFWKIKAISCLTHFYSWTLVGNLTRDQHCLTSLNRNQKNIPMRVWLYSLTIK